jgi:hypothetical protein
VTTWTLADLAHLLGRQGWCVCPTTVARTRRALGYRYRRPRHDLPHRQDRGASSRVAWPTAASKSGTGCAAFLEQVAQLWSDQTLMLVIDNASDHRSAAMREWWADQDARMVPVWLPTDALHRTRPARVWRFRTHTLARHRCWADPAGLTQAAGTDPLGPDHGALPPPHHLPGSELLSIR